MEAVGVSEVTVENDKATALWDHVKALCESVGLNPKRVEEVRIEPTQALFTVFVENPDGSMKVEDFEPVRNVVRVVR